MLIQIILYQMGIFYISQKHLFSFFLASVSETQHPLSNYEKMMITRSRSGILTVGPFIPIQKCERSITRFEYTRCLSPVILWRNFISKMNHRFCMSVQVFTLIGRLSETTQLKPFPFE